MNSRTASSIVLTLLLASMLTLAFNVRPVRASGTIYIRPDGSVDPDTASIQRDGDTYTFTDDIYDSIVVERSNIVVEGATYAVQGTGVWLSRGIDLSGRSNVTIKGVEITGWDYGVYLSYSSNNSVSGNNVTSNFAGILLSYSSDNNFSVNNITENSHDGIMLYGSPHNTISRNNIAENNRDGIMLSGSSNSSFLENNITENARYGIALWYYSNNNSIFGNSLVANDQGGIGLLQSSSDNFIHHNSFVNNANAYTSASVNEWDDGYPSGGNYWSDYAGVDSNEDGIGDTPYVIDENNQDRYPLMKPWRERTVGVKVGDWAKYTVDTSWTGVLDPRLEMLSETEWASIEVTDVQGTMVTFTGTSHFKNGSERTAFGVKWDIAPTGSFGFIFWFVSSDLQAGDKLFPIGILTINETVTRTYCGVPRENNYVNWSTSFSIVPGPPYDSNEASCYWDQATGILTEELLESSTGDLSSSLSIYVKMVDTNLWEAPIPTTIDELKTKIEELGSQGEIDNQGILNGLVRKLNVAQKLVDKGKTDEAIMVLEDFVTQVQELSGIHITLEAADILEESAEYLMSHL